jgi:dihydroorotate dehydrogenase (fumarate)
MAELHTHYLGLNLRNPFIVSSSGLTKSVNDLKEAERAGAGAVVLKSLFEEQILLDASQHLNQASSDSLIYSEYSESLDYIDYHIREKELSTYLNLVRDAKKELLIPVIASINCVTSGEWVNFAKKIEESGADALELNIAILPYNENVTDEEIEQRYFNIVKQIKAKVSIPVAVKIGSYFTNPVRFIKNLDECGVDGIVIFNRFFNPDIDIDDFEVVTTNLYSNEAELFQTLRWLAIMSGKVKCNLAASTGIHSGEAMIKALLAGAKVVEVSSAIYKNGLPVIQQMLGVLENWMDKKNFLTTDQFIGKMSQYNMKNPEVYERIQFMRYYSGIK